MRLSSRENQCNTFTLDLRIAYIVKYITVVFAINTTPPTKLMSVTLFTPVDEALFALFCQNQQIFAMLTA